MKALCFLLFYREDLTNNKISVNKMMLPWKTGNIKSHKRRMTHLLCCVSCNSPQKILTEIKYLSLVSHIARHTYVLYYMQCHRHQSSSLLHHILQKWFPKGKSRICMHTYRLILQVCIRNVHVSIKYFVLTLEKPSGAKVRVTGRLIALFFSL